MRLFLKILILSTVLLLNSFTGRTQIHLNDNLRTVLTVQFGAGLVDGMRDSYLYHYNDRHRALGMKPNSVAWENKWAKDAQGNVLVGQERFWQSSRALVFTTDFLHFSKFLTNRLNETSILAYSLGEVTFYEKELSKYRGLPWNKQRRIQTVTKRKIKIKKKKWYNYPIDFGLMFLARSAGFYLTYELIFAK